MFELANILKKSAAIIPQAKLSEILSINDKSRYYNLQLTEKDVRELVAVRNLTLKDTERIEFGVETLEYIINTFYKSPYINQHEYVEIIAEIQALFYLVKNEVDEIFSDEELITMLSEMFDGFCNGSLEFLKGRGVEHILEAAKIKKQEQEAESRWT